MKGLYLVAVGSLPANAMDWIESAVAEWFPLPIRRLPPLSVPAGAYDARRGQYQSVEMMKLLAQHAPRDASRILGVTDVDLAIPMLSFLFGQAQFDGPVALVSLCRLHQEFYGLPSQETLLRERTVKEVLHELGHTFGLVHCADPTCVMSLATHIELVDAKAERYCARCGTQLVHRFSLREATV
ncbi:MAG TPA: archaemetzincin [Candidatus Sulfotelmatobacter sp.]|nr:archaemetzincin [Candidatus Sulfotelmatobacter sp.]